MTQNPSVPPRLEGSRIVLRPPDPAVDAPGVHELFLDPELHRWTGNRPFSGIKEAEAWLRRLMSVEEIFFWVIIEKETARLAGTWWMARPVRQGGKRVITAEAQRIGKAWRGTGVTQEARRLLYDWAFQELEADEIHAQCREENTASRRSMEKAGFRLAGLAEKWFEKEQKMCTELQFVLARGDWFRKKRK